MTQKGGRGDQAEPLVGVASGGAGRRTTDAFSIAANETRLAILLTLWKEYAPIEGENAVSFTELRDRVGIRQGGQFNYHLEKLVGQFVDRVDGGYTITNAGLHLVQAVIAGRETTERTVEPATIAVDCPLCGGSVEVSYEEKVMRARCTQCAGIWQDEESAGFLFRFDLPPAGLTDRTLVEAFHATVTYNFHQIASFRSGVCPRCSGAVSETVHVCKTHDSRERQPCPTCERHYMSEVVVVCTHCKEWFCGPLAIAALTHPTVTAFYHDHGIDHRFDSWEAFCRSQTLSEELLAEEPLRIRMRVPCEDDELFLTFDEQLNIIDVSESDRTMAES